MFGREKWLRNGSLMGVMLLASWMVFHQTSFPLEFLLFPMLVVVVNVVGFSGAVLCLNGLTIIAAAATIHGTGPFLLLQGSQAPYRMLMLQIFLITAMVMSFAVTLIQLERKAFEEQLNHALKQMQLLATHDSLTGLGNRRLFENSLQAEWNRAMREGRSIALLLLDADCFKSYNDLYGHLAGDHFLCLIASVLQPAVRRAGDLAARYGGEEFVVLLPGSDMEDALRAGEVLRQKVEALNVPHRGNPHKLATVSVGCSAVVPSPHVQPTYLVKEADRALYVAKHAGRNRVEASAPGVLKAG
jgi:diguanylate cyclase (GGDEF)-like protein